MAISTYSELKTALANWLNRADLSDRIPEFVAMAEARMNRDGRLRTVDSLRRDTLGCSSQFTALPDDFGRMVNLEVQSEPVVVLQAVTPDQIDAVRAQMPSGNPGYYCVQGNELEVAPEPAEEVTLGIIYYRRIEALSDTNTSNWLLSAAPDIYLYACLSEAQPFLHEDERLGVFESLYGQRCAEYAMSSEEDQSGGVLVVRGSSFA